MTLYKVTVNGEVRYMGETLSVALQIMEQLHTTKKYRRAKISPEVIEDKELCAYVYADMDGKTEVVKL